MLINKIPLNLPEPNALFMVKCTLESSKNKHLIEKLLGNNITNPELEELRKKINEYELAIIIQKIYDLNENQVLEVAALARVMGWIDGVKNSWRNGRFTKKIKNNFRNGSNKIILAEGDSWFNYPVILSDIVDWIGMEDNMAVYSLANGGDWLLNMLNARKYVEELSVLHPDVFLISGGGNDLVGKSRVGAIVDPSGLQGQYEKSHFAQMLMEVIVRERKPPIVPIEWDRFYDGVKYLSKDFFALLLFFHMKYSFLIDGILCGGTNDPSKGKFPGIQIITQGYDYVLPDNSLGPFPSLLHWFRPIVRKFLGHGTWLKTPLQMRGINHRCTQKNIVYAMIYLFNEMMIFTGNKFCEIKGLEHSVFHIDSRGSVGENGWTDELHPLPKHFKDIGETFVRCINQKDSSPHGQVFVVNPKPEEIL